jgi:hypothetical protein
MDRKNTSQKGTMSGEYSGCGGMSQPCVSRSSHMRSSIFILKNDTFTLLDKFELQWLQSSVQFHQSTSIKFPSNSFAGFRQLRKGTYF